MKRILFLFFIIVMALSVTACNPQVKSPSEGTNSESPSGDDQSQLTYNTARESDNAIFISYADLSFEEYVKSVETTAIIEIEKYDGSCDSFTLFSANIEEVLFGKSISNHTVTVYQMGDWKATIPGWPLHQAGDRYIAFLEQTEKKPCPAGYFVTSAYITLQIHAYNNVEYVVIRGFLSSIEGITPVEDSLGEAVKESLLKSDPVLKNANMGNVYKYQDVLNYMEELANKEDN